MVSPARASDPAAAPRPHRFGPTARRGVLVVASAGAVTALVLAVPSLADVRHRLASIDAGWLALGVLLEIGSCAGFALVFHVFVDRVPAPLARRIAWVEMASGALLPGGGL